MKKIPVIIATAILLNGMLPFNSNAVDVDYSDLFTLASSLGADTDCLNIKNYKHDLIQIPVPMNSYRDYLKNLTVLEAFYAPAESFSATVLGGSCMGIAMLEILAHNGMISPQDIQQEAKSLNEISFSSDVDKIITDYQCMQLYTEFDNYEKYLITNIPYTEQVDRLISTAERNMADNRYFLISIRAEKFSHAVCGIGVADGEWEWDGKNYNKCILTLDSNVAKSETNNIGFSPKTCIYINSETNESYIPAYKLSADKSLAFAVIDDDSFLNYRGMINRPEIINTDASFIKQISYRGSKKMQLYSIDSNGAMTPFDEPKFNSWLGSVNLIDGVSVHADVIDEVVYPAVRYINPNRWIEVSIDSEPVNETYNAEFDISENNASIKATGDMLREVCLQMRLNEGTYDYSPYFAWTVLGFDVSDNIEIEAKEKGILVKSNGFIKSSVNARYFLTDDDGELLFNEGYLVCESLENNNGFAYITSNNNVLVTINNEQEYEFYIDKDNDGEYEHKVQKGDVNFDGMIDACDSSNILAAYSDYSTGNNAHMINKDLADYNNDGYVDACDASYVLQKYVELSTIK